METVKPPEGKYPVTGDAAHNAWPAPVERASVGRRVWYWSGQDSPAPFNVADPMQAFDAGVLFVHADARVNLLVTDHFGETRSVHGVTLRNPADGTSRIDMHGDRGPGHATWMPYQVKKGTGSS